MHVVQPCCMISWQSSKHLVAIAAIQLANGDCSKQLLNSSPLVLNVSKFSLSPLVGPDTSKKVLNLSMSAGLEERAALFTGRYGISYVLC